MITQHRKLNLVLFLSILFSFFTLILEDKQDFWFSDLFEILPLPIIFLAPIIPGFIFGLLIQNHKLIGYIKESFWYSLTFGLIYGVIFGSIISFLDRDDGVTIFSIPLAILFFFLIGVTFSFFGMLIGVIPKYFSALKMRR